TNTSVSPSSMTRSSSPKRVRKLAATNLSPRSSRKARACRSMSAPVSAVVRLLTHLSLCIMRRFFHRRQQARHAARESRPVEIAPDAAELIEAEEPGHGRQRILQGGIVVHHQGRQPEGIEAQRIQPAGAFEAAGPEVRDAVAHVLADEVWSKYPRHVGEADAIEVAVGLTGAIDVAGRIDRQRDGVMETQLRTNQPRLVEVRSEEQDLDVLAAPRLELHALPGGAAQLLVAQPAFIEAERAHDGRGVISLARAVALYDQQLAAEFLEAV